MGKRGIERESMLEQRRAHMRRLQCRMHKQIGKIGDGAACDGRCVTNHAAILFSHERRSSLHNMFERQWRFRWKRWRIVVPLYLVEIIDMLHLSQIALHRRPNGCHRYFSSSEPYLSLECMLLQLYLYYDQIPP